MPVVIGQTRSKLKVMIPPRNPSELDGRGRKSLMEPSLLRGIKYQVAGQKKQ